ncbi:hypothetical protein MPL1032_130032 [Mesorhizobium plurifarium]|uniref:Uncharacterized protein n=1 Tax=Mesorhizobium plurifarium TaxID=69974 RepID=A0A0K2VQW3_MESPL|nr:hypothetical protein MPL1032_130032 [Mesorhizobium plurifarium]
MTASISRLFWRLMPASHTGQRVLYHTVSKGADTARLSAIEHDAEKCDAVFGRHHALFLRLETDSDLRSFDLRSSVSRRGAAM